MSRLRKREGDKLEILEVEEILKGRGYSRHLAEDPTVLQPKQYIKRRYTCEYDRLPGEDIYQLLWIEKRPGTLAQSA